MNWGLLWPLNLHVDDEYNSHTSFETYEEISFGVDLGLLTVLCSVS